MKVNRRRLLQSIAVASVAAPATAATETASLSVLRDTAVAHGTDLSDARLRVLQPVLASRSGALRAFRELEVDDKVAPVRGILES